MTTISLTTFAMREEENTPHKFESLSELHRALGLPNPQHPLVSLIVNDVKDVDVNRLPQYYILTYYVISYKTKLSGKIRYGQGHYDFNEGGILFASPNQIIGTHNHGGDHSGYVLMIHPDFLRNYPLAARIKKYGFFSYSANEALHLSDKEKEIVNSVFQIIENELNSRIDDFTQDVIIAQIELLLNYANRFYKRQFLTRKAVSNDLLQSLEYLLDEYFSAQKPLCEGIPTVQYLSQQLNVSPSYLSDMLRSLTGQNAQQHIHNKLIEKAKELLSTTQLTVSEVAFGLGFEHPQSFSKMFKSKTKSSPLTFRRSFN